MKITLISLALLISSNSYATFNRDVYEFKNAEEIYQKSKLFSSEEDGGQFIITPIKKIHLYEKIIRLPFKCDAFLAVNTLVVTTGIKRKNLPPINYCMSIETEKGHEVGLYVQDTIARYISEEYVIGNKIHLWTIWLFVNNSNKEPYFLINAIGNI